MLIRGEFWCLVQASQQRTSTRAKQTDTAKKSAMAELVAAKAARAQRSDAQKKCARWHCHTMCLCSANASSS